MKADFHTAIIDPVNESEGGKMRPVIDLSREYGIVLEGGGAKGAYQIGVWKAFREAGLKIRGVSGTSVGALNGALICMGDVEKAEHVWENISYSSIMDVDDEKMKRLMQGKPKVREIVRTLVELLTEGGIDITPLRELISECVDEEQLLRSPIALYVSMFNVDEFRELDVDIHQLEPDLIREVLVASACIFPLFKIEKLQGKTYIDGGAMDNVPLEPLLRRGYEDVIIVRIFGIGRDKPVKIPEGTTVLTVAPRIDLGNILDFDARKSKRNIQAGYYDGMRMIYGLDGIIYYIDDQKDEIYYMQKLAAMYKGDGSLHHFMETEPTKLALELRLTDWNYRKLFLAMLEATAKLCRVPKYCIYTVEELLQAVWERKTVLIETQETIPVFAQMILSSEGVRDKE